MKMRRRSCVVVGGGLAGLAAAYRLTQAGWNVVVLEAQDRLGGRVLSHRFEEAKSLVCELGAEWIGWSHYRMRRYCRVFGLRLQKHQYSSMFWDGVKRTKAYPPGAWCFAPALKRRFEQFGRTFNRLVKQNDTQALHELDQSDWWNVLERIGFSLEDRLKRDLMDSTDFGESIRLTSAYLAATEYFQGNATDEMDAKIVGGNDRLIGKLAHAIRRRGRLLQNVTVTRIGQDPDEVVIYARGRRQPLRAQFCVCTVPTPALCRIEWMPELPVDQRNAAFQLQYSRITKTAVLYPNRFWPTNRESGFSAFTPRASDYCFDATFRQKGRAGILCSYAIGDKADDVAGEPDQDLLGRWITNDMLAVVRPRAPGTVTPMAIKQQPWQRVPWIDGAYAFYRPGQWFSIRPILARPHGRVFFAGEHLSEPWQGFMEGAVETGEAAASRLIKWAS